MKALRFLAALILIIGASLTGRAVYMHAKAQLASVLIRGAWEQSLQSGEPMRRGVGLTLIRLRA